MPLEFEKSAGVVVKNFDDFVRTLKGAGKLRGSQTAEQVAKDIMYGRAGSGSLLVDYGTHIFGKKLGSKLRGGYNKFQHKISDFDIRAGSKIYDALTKKNNKSKILASEKLKEFKIHASNLDKEKRKQQLREILKLRNKGKFRSKVSDAFVFKHQVPLKESAPGITNKVVEVGVPGVSVPLEKSKRVILPFAGAMALNAQLANMQSTNREENKGGDGQMGEKKSHTKEELIEKISGVLFGENVNEKINNDTKKMLDIQKIASLTMTASKMLKYAAEENKKIKQEAEKLASDNKRLALELFVKERSDRATKLANLMNAKQMIKKADIESQVKKMIELDDDAFDMLKTAVENVNIESEKVGLDNLTFLDETYNINNIRDNKRQTLADSLEDATHEK